MIVVVPPIPVSSLVVLVQMTILNVRIMMGFDPPLVVIDDLIVVPAVTVVIIRIVIVATVLGSAASRWPMATPMHLRSEMFLQIYF